MKSRLLQNSLAWLNSNFFRHLTFYSNLFDSTNYVILICRKTSNSKIQIAQLIQITPDRSVHKTLAALPIGTLNDILMRVVRLVVLRDFILPVLLLVVPRATNGAEPDKSQLHIAQWFIYTIAKYWLKDDKCLPFICYNWFNSTHQFYFFQRPHF